MTETPPIREMKSETKAPLTLQLAIQERLLRGKTEADRVKQAATLGIRGIEYNSHGLSERVDDICAALQGAPVQAATVRLNTTYNFVAPDETTRQRALDHLRYAMTDAVDIGASGVVLVPHQGASLGLPDLMPLKAPIQIAVELMTLHLRTLSDLAYVFGIKLYLHPVNRYETAFLNRLDQGVELRRRIKFNEHVLLAADTYHMGMTEDNPLRALEGAAKSIGHVYLAANNGKLSDQGTVDFPSVQQILAEQSGWAVITRYGDYDSLPTQRDLRHSVNYLHEAGFV